MSAAPVTAGRSSPAASLRWTTGWLVATVVALLPVLSGCATIPHTGPVVSGRVVEADSRVGLVQVGGFGPVGGASPEEIVTGFLRVAAGFGDNHHVARSFLTASRQLVWRSDAKVTIYPTETLLKVKELGTRPTPSAAPTPPAAAGSAAAGNAGRVETWVRVTTPVNATIDDAGRYEAAAPGTQVTQSFGLIKVNGQWRIDELDNGILIGDIDFGVTFRALPVYFGDPTGRYLVPDLHWFPGTLDSPSSLELPTALVRALLKGPPPWMKGAVVSGAPPGTDMAVAAVVVEDDVATVDLTDQVRLADTWHRRLLVSQLQASLAQLRIGSVQITVRRTAFDVPSGSSDPEGNNDPSQVNDQPVTDPRVDVRPVLIDPKGRLARLDNGVLDVVENVAGLAVPGANRPAVSSDSSAYAVLNADRSKLLQQLPGAKAVTLVTSAGLTAPSYDPAGWVWTSPGTNTGFVYAAGPGAGAIKVKAPWLKGDEIVGLRISRDGTRAVVAVRVNGHAHIFLTGVLRDGDGKPQALSQPPRGLMPSLRTVRDVAWVDEKQVVVLGRRAGIGGEGPWIVQLGGVVVGAGTSVSGAESITAGNGDQSVMAGTTKGIQVRSRALWDTVSPGRWPAFPG
jgi:hypothetical protein